METRRYDIDWLRVITIGLLLIYHIAIVFQPWGVFIGFIQSSESVEWLWTPMSMLNVWRIPLLFFVSGMGVCFAMRKRNWKQLLIERTKRILVPFVFGFFAIVPIHILISQKYYEGAFSYVPNAGHLWFLGNIFAYVLILSPLFYLLKKFENGAFVTGFKKIFTHPGGLIVVAMVFMVEAMLLKPEPFELYAMTIHGFVMGLIAFFFGYCFVLCGQSFWNNMLKWSWLFLALGATLFTIRLLQFQLKAPVYFMAIESVTWIYAIFGFGYKHLNKPSKALSYLSKGAYPIYIIHMVLLYLGSMIILPLAISTNLKLILIIVFTVFGCLVLYDLLIRRVKILRPMFGLKRN